MAERNADPSNESSSNEEREARVEKLRLEIVALKNQQVWYKAVLDAMPFITVLITVAGLSAGAYKYFEDREDSRLVQRSTQLRADIDQLLSFPSDNKITLARITFLFHDLTRLTTSDSPSRVNVTDVVEKLIGDDLDFDKLRDVSFDVTAMSHWPDYVQRLKNSGGSDKLKI